MAKFIYKVDVELSTKFFIFNKKKNISFITVAEHRADAINLVNDYITDSYSSTGKNGVSSFNIVNVERKYKQESSIIYVDEK